MTKEKEDKYYYVTTAIAYVNAVPHIGFAYEVIIADTLARYHAEQGKTVFFSTGSDEHGGKIDDAAKELGVSTDRFVDQNVQALKDVLPVVGVKYTKFIRTSSDEHVVGAQEIWKRLEKYIYKGSYVGLYDKREETFVTEEEAKELMESDPERYDRLEKLEEDNYFFKLSAFTPKILKAISDNELRIVPETRRNEILNLLRDGLEDISVSRPKEKLSWGVPVPGDDKQVMYVWFEALMNYITTLGYPSGQEFEDFWPADSQVIGKDIIRFHAAIWPAMLIGLGLPLPKDIYAHGFITVDNSKISKSVGNVISPLELVSTYGTDAARYFLLRHIPSYSDGDFSWLKMENAYNGELGNELGNLVQRIVSMIRNYQAGIIGDLPEAVHDEGPYHSAMEDYRFDRALDYIWSMIKSLNQYIDEEKPWVLAKDEEEKEHLAEVLAYVSSNLLLVGKLLLPFMPATADIIIKTFSSDVVPEKTEPLFPRIHKYTEAKKKKG